MSPKKRRSQISFDARKKMKINQYFPQVAKEEQNDSNISHVKAESTKRLKEITNTQDERSHGSKKTQQDQTTSSNKTISFMLDVNQRKNKKMKHKLMCSETYSLYEGLNTLDVIKEEVERNPGKEMLVCGKEGIEGYINLGMPLSCFPEGSQVVITFSRNETEQKEDKSVFGRQDQASSDCVKFYIHAVGKRKKKILKLGELHEEGNKLCVYGFKGETIKDTLRKDGRFKSFVENDRWKLITDLDTILENSQPVDGLEGKLFQVEVEIKKKSRAVSAAAAQNSEVEQRKFQKLKEHIVNEYPSLTREREKIRAFIKEESDKRKKKASLFKVHKTYHRKLTRNSIPVKLNKLITQASDSVGYIYWNNNGNEGCATCFVLTGPYILTCRHVINDIVGKGIELSQWADVIGRCTKVIFDYEEFSIKEDNCFLVEPWFEISDVTLDYAVLQLRENRQQMPSGLYNGIGPVPLSGLVCITGHSDGEKKSTDYCSVVPKSERSKKSEENMLATGCNSYGQYIHLFSKRSFLEMRNPQVVTYNTSFYVGSSGSPVLDSAGSLVAMHTAGITVPYQNGVSNIIEFGSTMECILADIKQKYESWYMKNFISENDIEMLSQEN